MIELRPFERKDFATLRGWITTPKLLFQWAGVQFRYPLDEAQLEVYYQRAQGDPPASYIFAAVDAETQAMGGHVALSGVNRRHQSARLACVLIGPPLARGRGLGTAMVRKVVEYGFSQLGLHRIDLSVFDFNAPAIRCYEKLGFVKEGLLRDVLYTGSEYWNAYLMSVLDSEWKGA